MAVDRISPAHRPLGLVGGVRWLAYHFCSLETCLVLFLYGAHLKAILPALPVPLPETVLYGALSIGIGLWVMVREGIYWRGIPIVIAGFLLTGWMVISYGWTPSRMMAQESLPFVMVINLWAVFVAGCIVAGSRERVLRLFVLLMLLAGLLSAIGSYIYFLHGDFRFYRGPYGEWHHRTYLAWGNTITTGAAVALALALHARWGSAKQLFGAAIFVCCLYFLMVSGARGALLGTLSAGVVAFVATSPRLRDGQLMMARAQLLALFLIGIIVVYFTYLVGTDQTPTTINRFLQLFDQADDPLLRRGANRFDYFAGAYRAWLDAPLFGQGLAGFTIVFCGVEQPGCHPHNIFLQSLADHGIIGGLLLAAFVLIGLHRYRIAQLHDDPLSVVMLMVFATIFVYVMVATDLPTAHRFFFFVGLLAMRPPAAEADDDVEDDDETVREAA